jgi:serine phosphatase RsbU (regulator of sigma subunit)
VVLDVTGHGIAAALTVNRIVGELERLFAEREQMNPREVLAALNRYVHLTLARHRLYVTALCLRADVSRGVLEYASGGHPTAFLRRGDGTIEMLPSTAMILGVMDDSHFESIDANVPFAPGDAVIAYTDGAAEARNTTGRQLGTLGVQDILARIANSASAPADWPGAVMRRVLDYRGAPPEDDTLVVTLFRPLK